MAHLSHRLQEASALLAQTSEPAAEDLTAALQLVRSSSLNCYMFEALPDDTFETRASLLTQQYELSVSTSSGWQTVAAAASSSLSQVVPQGVRHAQQWA